MDSILIFIKKILKHNKAPEYHTGPNTFDELLEQFDQPKKVKTVEEIIKDYQIKETIKAIEVDFLRSEPSKAFYGSQKFEDKNSKFIDFVPCIVRPEVIFCSYGKN